jgi:hypothetical protein
MMSMCAACGAANPAAESTGNAGSPKSPRHGRGGERYPNELPHLRLWHAGRWNELEPLVSTLADVRRVLGTPADANDIGQYSEPYPGDDRAKQPVLRYTSPAVETVLAYTVRSDLSVSGCYPASLQQRLLSVDLIHRVELACRDLWGPRFRNAVVVAADASWREFRDPAGLRYQVVGCDASDGRGSGRLKRIVYGPSDDAEAKAWARRQAENRTGNQHLRAGETCIRR